VRHHYLIGLKVQLERFLCPRPNPQDSRHVLSLNPPKIADPPRPLMCDGRALRILPLSRILLQPEKGCGTGGELFVLQRGPNEIGPGFNLRPYLPGEAKPGF